MKILLIETETGGHHISLYLNAVVKKLLSNKIDVTVLTLATPKKNTALDYLKNKKVKIIYLDKYNKINSSNYLAISFNQIKLYYLIKKRFKEMKDIDHVFLNTFTIIDKAISIFGTPFSNTKFSGIYPAIKFNYNQKIFFLNRIKNLVDKFFFIRMLKIKTLNHIFIPDPIFVRYSKKNIINYRKIFDLSDFGFFNTNMKKYKKSTTINSEITSFFKKKDFVILVYGAIRYGKGVHYLLEAVKKFKTIKKLKIVIAGKQDNFAKNIINIYKRDSKFKEILFILNYFIPTNLENYLFKKTDMVWTGTTKNYMGSSGVFFLSAKYKKPVITSNHGLINFYNKKYKIGYCVEIDNINKINKLLKNITSNPKKIPDSYFDNVIKSHNSENTGKNVIRRIISKNLRS
tara:strand:- start:980 stop:2185 length:1206 start_codon:yes stop_codon:yes gene_type:complete